MNCEKFADMLDNYACLSDEELRELEAHSKECESCASELDFMRSILAAAKELPPIEPPSDFLDSLNSRLDAELAKENPVQRFMRRSRPYVSRYGAAAACVALVAVVGINAGTLLTRMNNNGDGVISEQKTASDPVGTGENVLSDKGLGDAAPSAFPQTETSSALGNALNSAVPAPAAPSAAPGIAASTAPSAAAGSNAKPAAPAAAQAPAAQSRTSSPVSTNDAPRAPQQSAQQSAPQQYAPQQYAPQQSTAQQPSSQGAPAEQATPQSVAEAVPQAALQQTAKQEAAATPQTETPQSSVKEEETYQIAQNEINSSNEYSSVAEYGITEEDYEAGIDAELSDYTLANLGTEQASTYASLSSTVSVKAKDVNRVKELVDVFINGVYGNYYMITSKDMDGLLGQFDREGIWYSANITESGDTISFRLVVMQMD